jgi:hypothetical protein
MARKPVTSASPKEQAVPKRIAISVGKPHTLAECAAA